MNVVLNFAFVTLTLLCGMKKVEAGTNGIIRVVNNVARSGNDSRDYRGLLLNNNLKVLLIHDPAATSAAVALSVNTGSLDDPKDLPGLINLLGMTILLGSEKHRHFFTGETRPLSRTTTRWQTHSVLVEAFGDPLYKALREFASYFTDPLLADADPNIIDSIIMSADDILLGSVNRNLLKIYQVERTLANEEHPLSHLTPNNKDILYGYPGPIYDKKIFEEHRSEVRELINAKLRESFDSRYSANMMTLVLLAKDSLDTMEEQIPAIFGGIENKRVQKPVYEGKQYLSNPGKLGLKIYIELDDAESKSLLRVSFPTPDIHDQHPTAPQRYVGYLLEHHEPGGLAAVLKEKDLCLFPRTTYDFVAALGVYSITCFPTPKGLDHVDDIVGLIFQYIKLVKTVGVNEETFKKLQIIDRTIFKYEIKEWSPLAYVENLASNLHDYDMTDVVSYKYIHQDWNQPLIENFLSHLTPKNFSVTVVGKNIMGTETSYEKEKWLDTKYKIEKIKDETIATWTDTEPSDELRLPVIDITTNLG